MTILRWEDPPPLKDGADQAWATDVANVLAERPGTWAVVGEYRQPMDAIKPISLLAKVPNVWTTRRTADRCTTLYACWSKNKPEEPRESDSGS